MVILQPLYEKCWQANCSAGYGMVKIVIKYKLPAAALFAVAVFAAVSGCKQIGPADNIIEIVDSVLPEPEPPAIVRINSGDIRFAKDLTYDQYTLEDVYPYRDTARRFQWNKIRNLLVLIENSRLRDKEFGVVQNRRNASGEASLVDSATINAYENAQDRYGVERYQSAPLYLPGDTLTPDRYATDGGLLRIDGQEGSFLKVTHVYYDGEWLVPAKYVKNIGKPRFDHIACVDVTNQNIATLERSDSVWLVRSMNPATTGVHNPPYAKETPLGIFVVQEKKTKMYYYIDGTTIIAGYAPWASRFSNGGYIHGVPTNHPEAPIIEYGWTLGTTPRSHMCVRNASSHAKFIFDSWPVFGSLVIVLE